jgi:hypothetical protein
MGQFGRIDNPGRRPADQDLRRTDRRCRGRTFLRPFPGPVSRSRAAVVIGPRWAKALRKGVTLARRARGRCATRPLSFRTTGRRIRRAVDRSGRDLRFPARSATPGRRAQGREQAGRHRYHRHPRAGVAHCVSCLSCRDRVSARRRPRAPPTFRGLQQGETCATVTQRNVADPVARAACGRSMLRHRVIAR